MCSARRRSGRPTGEREAPHRWGMGVGLRETGQEPQHGSGPAAAPEPARPLSLALFPTVRCMLGVVVPSGPDAGALGCRKQSLAGIKRKQQQQQGEDGDSGAEDPGMPEDQDLADQSDDDAEYYRQEVGSEPDQGES